MDAEINRQITQIARERRGARPRGLISELRKHPLGSGEISILRLLHRLLTDTAYANPGIPDASADSHLTEYGREHVGFAIDDIMRRENRSDIFQRRLYFNEHEPARPWTIYTSPPTWTLLAHPLMVHALTRAGCNDLPGSMMANIATPSPGVRVRVVQDLLVGSCPIDPSDPARGRVFSDDMGVSLQLQGLIPHVVQTALIGKPIGDLIELPTSGDDNLDVEVAGLIIQTVIDAEWNGNAGTMVTFTPARWRGCAHPPPNIDENKLRTPGKVA